MRVQVCPQANPDPIHWRWSIDRLGRITYSSSAVELLLGFRAEEIIGGPSRRFVHPRDFGLVPRTFGASPETETKSGLFRVKDKKRTHPTFHATHTNCI